MTIKIYKQNLMGVGQGKEEDWASLKHSMIPHGISLKGPPLCKHPMNPLTDHNLVFKYLFRKPTAGLSGQDISSSVLFAISSRACTHGTSEIRMSEISRRGYICADHVA